MLALNYDRFSATEESGQVVDNVPAQTAKFKPRPALGLHAAGGCGVGEL